MSEFDQWQPPMPDAPINPPPPDYNAPPVPQPVYAAAPVAPPSASVPSPQQAYAAAASISAAPQAPAPYPLNATPPQPAPQQGWVPPPVQPQGWAPPQPIQPFAQPQPVQLQPTQPPTYPTWDGQQQPWQGYQQPWDAAPVPKKKRSKKGWIFGSIGGVLVIAILIGVFFGGSLWFRLSYNMNADGTAKWVQNAYSGNKSTSGYIQNFVDGKQQDAYDQYNSGKLSFDQAQTVINRMVAFDEKSGYPAKLTALKASKDSFAAAETSAKNGSYSEALYQYNQVIKEDANYPKVAADEKSLYDTVCAQLDTYKQNNEYTEGMTLIQSVTAYYPNDSKLDQYQTDFLAQQRTALKKQAEDAQIVTVTDAETDLTGGVRYAFVDFHNAGTATVTDIYCTFLMFDSSNNPVVYTGIYTNTGCDAANAMAGRMNGIKSFTAGTDKTIYWSDMPSDALRIKCCVRSAILSDGTTWTNPYFDYWAEDEAAQY